MSATSYSTPRLYRSTTDRKIAGVCGGIAHEMGWDPTVVRLAFALSLLLPGPQAVAYLIAWVLLPEEATPVAAPPGDAPQGVPSSPGTPMGSGHDES